MSLIPEPKLPKAQVITMTCSNCKFAFPEGQSIFCRRYPATVFMTEPVQDANGETARDAYGNLTGIKTWSQFPTVAPIAWCGEHKLDGGKLN